MSEYVHVYTRVLFVSLCVCVSVCLCLCVCLCMCCIYLYGELCLHCLQIPSPFVENFLKQMATTKV